jgi:transposase
VSSKRGNYSPEFKEAAVREVIEKSRPIADVARENGLVAQTLGNWVNAWRAEHVGEESVEAELTLSERARLKELERENRELRMENEFLGKATAFFAKKHK